MRYTNAVPLFIFAAYHRILSRLLDLENTRFSTNDGIFEGSAMPKPTRLYRIGKLPNSSAARNHTVQNRES